MFHSLIITSEFQNVDEIFLETANFSFENKGSRYSPQNQNICAEGGFSVYRRSGGFLGCLRKWVRATTFYRKSKSCLREINFLVLCIEASVFRASFATTCDASDITSPRTRILPFTSITLEMPSRPKTFT